MAVTVSFRGGFTTAGQAVLIALSGLALLDTAIREAPSVLNIARRALLVWVLAGLGLLALASAAWTIAPRADALRAGVVILAYAAIMVCAGASARRCGSAPFAIGLAVLAAAEAIVGLSFAALHALPDAERIGATWRPGGTFEYPPALALVQAGSLPSFCWLAHRRSPARANGAIRAAGAVGAMLAGAALGCAGSRLAVALAAAVLVLVSSFASSVGGSPRSRSILSLLVLLCAIGAHFALGTRAAAGAQSAGALRLAGVFAMCGALAALWPTLRARAERAGESRRAPLAVVGVLAALAALVVLGAVLEAREGAGAAPSGGITHARGADFSAAAKTWLDRPVAGAGAGAYFLASARHQGVSPVRFAHNLPLELAAELGAGGLALGLLLYGATAQLVWQARKTDAAWLLGPLVAMFLVSNLVDWPWHLTGLGATWAAAAGGLAGCVASSARPPAARSRASMR